jgi:hypothetical protein
MERQVRMSMVGIAVLLLVIAATFVYALTIMREGELAEKKEWSVLQGTEVKYRNSSDSQSTILLFNPLDSPYVVLGVPTHDSHFPRVWIILNETIPTSSIYILPQNMKYYISCSEVANLALRTTVHPRVLETLNRECIP